MKNGKFIGKKFKLATLDELQLIENELKKLLKTRNFRYTLIDSNIPDKGVIITACSIDISIDNLPQYFKNNERSYIRNANKITLLFTKQDGFSTYARLQNGDSMDMFDQWSINIWLNGEEKRKYKRTYERTINAYYYNDNVYELIDNVNEFIDEYRKYTRISKILKMEG